MNSLTDPDKKVKIPSIANIEKQIMFLRGEFVLLSYQLAELYGVETRVLNQSVKRNRRLFPEGSIFQLSNIEFRDIEVERTSYSSWGGARRANPYAFTAEAVILLQYLLKDHGSDEQDFNIIRAFTARKRCSYTPLLE